MRRSIKIAYELLLDICTEGTQMLAVNGDVSTCIQGVGIHAQMIGVVVNPDRTITVHVDDPDYPTEEPYALVAWRRDMAVQE